VYLAESRVKKYNKTEKEQHNQMKIKKREEGISARNKIMSLVKD